MAKKKEPVERKIVKGRISGKIIYLVTAEVVVKEDVAVIEDVLITVSGRLIELSEFVARFGIAKAKLAIEKSVMTELPNASKVTLQLRTS